MDMKWVEEKLHKKAYTMNLMGKKTGYVLQP